ncbi:hypothetical protein GGR56DRAFT_692289 [Xylariaceae sp. FL0804]|nr:hypothetical protein GGR56DRAFT_692289 [Xylariaceae sp. FL0804]
MATRTVTGRRVAAGLGVAALGAAAAAAATMRTAQADDGAPEAAFGRAPVFHSLRLQSSEPVSPDVRRLTFELPRADMVSGIPGGSAVVTASWPPGSWLPVVRPYTPISSVDERGMLELMVKRYPNGKQSTHLHSLAPGDTLRFMIRKPGDAPYAPGQYSDVALIAGGAGITPCYALLRRILAEENEAEAVSGSENKVEKTRVTLVVGANTAADLLLRDEVAELERAFPGQLRAVWTATEPATATQDVRRGRVTQALLEEVLARPDGARTKVFLSGPPGMESALVGKQGVLAQLGYTSDQIHQF